MSRFLLFLSLMLLLTGAVEAQSVTGTFRNAVGANPVTAGTLSLYNLSARAPVFTNLASGGQWSIFNGVDYRVQTDQDRFVHSNEWQKHHLWDYQVQEYRLTNDFSVSQGVNEITKTAVFTNARKTTLFHNFEEFTDEGEVRFRDPWYVDAQDEQPGGFLPFASPYVPTGAYGRSEPAVLLGKTVQATFPFYSLKFHSFLQSDYETPTSPALSSADWVFVGAYARNVGDVELADDFIDA